MIKETSKLLTWCYNHPIKSLKYHKTEVLSVNFERKEVTFRHDRWLTKNTARAMSFGLARFLHRDIAVKHECNKHTHGKNRLTITFRGEISNLILCPIAMSHTFTFKELGIES